MRRASGALPAATSAAMAEATGTPGGRLRGRPRHRRWSRRTRERGGVSAVSAPQATASTVEPTVRASVNSSSVVAVRPASVVSASTQTFSIAMVVRAPRNWCGRRCAYPASAGGSLLDDLECLEEGDDARSAVTLVDDDLARRTGLGFGDVGDLLPAPAAPTVDASRPRSATVRVSTGLDLAAMMPLKEGSGARPRRRSRSRGRAAGS